MDVKIKHVYGDPGKNGEAIASNYLHQRDDAPDGDDGGVVTATIYNAPNKGKALEMANNAAFWPKLHSVDYSALVEYQRTGKIIKQK